MDNKKINSSEVDWSTVPIDTPIYVKEAECTLWIPAHFAKYEYGQVYAFRAGKTSFTNGMNINDGVSWPYAKIAEDQNNINKYSKDDVLSLVNKAIENIN